MGDGSHGGRRRRGGRILSGKLPLFFKVENLSNHLLHLRRHDGIPPFLDVVPLPLVWHEVIDRLLGKLEGVVAELGGLVFRPRGRRAVRLVVEERDDVVGGDAAEFFPREFMVHGVFQAVDEGHALDELALVGSHPVRGFAGCCGFGGRSWWPWCSWCSWCPWGFRGGGRWVAVGRS